MWRKLYHANEGLYSLGYSIASRSTMLASRGVTRAAPSLSIADETGAGSSKATEACLLGYCLLWSVELEQDLEEQVSQLH